MNILYIFYLRPPRDEVGRKVDSVSYLGLQIGNGFFFIFIFLAKLFVLLLDKMQANFDNRKTGNFFRRILGYILFIFTFLINVTIAINSRKNEFEADYFAYEIGYGENLVESLYVFHETSMNRKMTLKEKLISSHPHLAKRIARLEEIIDNEDTTPENTEIEQEQNNETDDLMDLNIDGLLDLKLDIEETQMNVQNMINKCDEIIKRAENLLSD